MKGWSLNSGSFLFIYEPVLLKFLTNNNVDFQSGTASFQRSMKWACKALFVTITDSSVFKKRFNCKRTVYTGPSHDCN